MQYFISFLEGIITFISPCLLPLLPVYISYFAGGGTKNEAKDALPGALGFVLGFTLVFVTLGAFAGFLGGALNSHRWQINIITGLIVIMFGLSYMGVLFHGLFGKIHRWGGRENIAGFSEALIFGVVFSLGWTPCVGAFLGSALMLASYQGSAAQGVLMLLCYSVGLGIPFLICAVLIERLKFAFGWIKNNYKTINTVSGLLLVVMGILMATGLMGRAIALLSF